MLKFGMTPVIGNDEEDDEGRVREIMEKENVNSNHQAEARQVFFLLAKKARRRIWRQVQRTYRS
jgi:hypothetical protein